jgi:oxygen tolerance protein BatD
MIRHSRSRSSLSLFSLFSPFSLFVALLWVCLLVSHASFAQGKPSIQVQVDQDTVGVGDVIHLQMTVSSGDAMPDDALPGPTPGFVVHQPSTAPTQTHININGNRSDRFTLIVDWPLEAKKTGTFTVGPPTVDVGNSRFSTGSGITVRVVPAGQAPRRAQPPAQGVDPFGFTPFDPWKQLFPGMQPGDPMGGQAPSATTDPKLQLDSPRGNFYFLHATVDKTSAVVGEQVTFSIYEYTATNLRAEIDAEDVHDAQVADFIKHALLKDDQDSQLEGFATIGGQSWKVILVKRWALFPLRAGDLEIGPMSVTLVRPRAAAGTKRTTETLRVHVVEPPVATRPPGYAIGDVGRFALETQVTPREAEQDGAVAVHVEVAGTGNVPATITTPAREGVEWLTPEVHEQLGPIGHDAFGGKRSFDYVVRIHRSGDVDLGEIALPFWDPEKSAYDVARAPVGVVHVKPSSVGAAAAASAAGQADQEALPDLPSQRDVLEHTRTSPRRHLDDSPLPWLLGIGAWPLAFGVVVAGGAAGRKLASAWRGRRESPAAELDRRVAAARTACSGGDARAADAAIARALEAAALARGGVSIRGAVGEEVLDRLVGAGVTRESAARLAELLRHCESARFSPSAADVAAARERWHEAQRTIRELRRA